MQRKEICSDQSLREKDIIMEIAAFACRNGANRQFEEIANDPDACDFSPAAAGRLHNKVMAGFAEYRKKLRARNVGPAAFS